MENSRTAATSLPTATVLDKLNPDRAIVPRQWYNLASDIPFEMPRPLHPTEDRPVEMEDFSFLYSTECLRIELGIGQYADSPWINVPDQVYEEYLRYRPSPLMRATGLEAYLATPAEIYFKREDLNPGGSHKFNTALPQAFYGLQDGVKTLVSDTGAGQWGTALAMACQIFGLNTVVFMIQKSYQEKPYRRYLMRLMEAEVISSPSDKTETGRRVLRDTPDNTGSLGIGMSEAIELVRSNGDHRLALGCMAYYAVMHQTVIGIETQRQLESIGRRPDALVGCVGGGSNFAGFIAPFVQAKLQGEPIDLIAVEPDSIPCFTNGTYRYDWADFTGLTPRIKMYTLGHQFAPPAIHSGGLRYHGKTPILSLLVHEGVVTPSAFSQAEVFKAGQLLLQTDHVLPAPESAHAVLAVIKEALKAKEQRQKKVVVGCLSGQGFLDLKGYADVLNL